MVAALDLAKYIVHKANDMNESITHLKLQKILYYVAGVFAGALNKYAFSDSIEAWQYGPVVRNVYIEFCSWGSLPLICDESIVLNYDAKQKELVDFVVDLKIKMSGRELVNATHQETPWKRHAHNISVKPEISYEELREYFKNSDEVKQWKTRIQ